MKKISILLLALCLCFTSCLRDIVQTDTWTCSVVLRSDSSDDKSEVCLVKGGNPDAEDQSKRGDNFYIDVYSSHSSLTILSCELDIVDAATRNSYFSPGMTMTFDNGHRTVSLGYGALHIEDTGHHVFRLRVKDDLSGQEREFVKDFYTYRNFVLDIVFRKEDTPGNWRDCREGDETPSVVGMNEVRYRLYTNQTKLYIKDFAWEQNQYQDVPFSQYAEFKVNPANKVGKDDPVHAGLYFIDFIIPASRNDIPQSVGDSSGDVELWVEAYGDDFNTDIYEKAVAKYRRYYNTELHAQLSNINQWEEGIDENDNCYIQYDRKAYLKVRCNRQGLTFKIKNPSAAPSLWSEYGESDAFNCSDNNGRRLANDQSVTFRDGFFSLATNELTSSYLVTLSEGFAYTSVGNIKFTLKSDDDKIPIMKDFVIKYELVNKVLRGPDSFTLSDYYRTVSVSGSNPYLTPMLASEVEGHHFNQGEYFAFKIKPEGLGSDGYVEVSGPASGGAVDFLFLKKVSDNGAIKWATRNTTNTGWDESNANSNPFEFDDKFCGYGNKPQLAVSEFRNDIYLFVRGLDRGGETNISIRGTIPNADSQHAYKSVSSFVRYRLAVIISGIFGDGGIDIGNCGRGHLCRNGVEKFNWGSKNCWYGWVNTPKSIILESFEYGAASGVPSNNDVLKGDDFNGDFQKVNLIKKYPQGDNAKFSLRISMSTITSEFYAGPNNYNGRELLVVDYDKGGIWECPYCSKHKSRISDTPPASTVLFADWNSSSSNFDCSAILKHLKKWNRRFYNAHFNNMFSEAEHDFQENNIHVNIIPVSCSGFSNDYEFRWFINGFKCSNGGGWYCTYQGDYPYGSFGSYWWSNLDDTILVQSIPNN